MLQTMDITDIPADLVADHATGERAAAAAPTVDSWLYAMWGIRPDTNSKATAPGSFGYPPEIAEWLHRMWGIRLADVSTPKDA